MILDSHNNLRSRTIICSDLTTNKVQKYLSGYGIDGTALDKAANDIILDSF